MSKNENINSPQGGVKGWHDLRPEELIEAVENSDPRTFKENGADPYMVINKINENGCLSPEEKRLLIQMVQRKATLVKPKED